VFERQVYIPKLPANGCPLKWVLYPDDGGNVSPETLVKICQTTWGRNPGFPQRTKSSFKLNIRFETRTVNYITLSHIVQELSVYL
jgi:hypothetical protein